MKDHHSSLFIFPIVAFNGDSILVSSDEWLLIGRSSFSRRSLFFDTICFPNIVCNLTPHPIINRSKHKFRGFQCSLLFSCLVGYPKTSYEQYNVYGKNKLCSVSNCMKWGELRKAPSLSSTGYKHSSSSGCTKVWQLNYLDSIPSDSCGIFRVLLVRESATLIARIMATLMLRTVTS